MSEIRRPKIGLALGSGGSKGLSHIGVIKILEANRIPIDYIAGSSIGSLVGGFYAYKKDIGEVEEIALSNNWRDFIPIFLDLSLRHGLIKGEKVNKFIASYIHDITFDDLMIPFTAVATCLTSSEPALIREGKVVQAIRASISFPIVFKPAEINNQLYIDGGVSMPVPVKAVREMGADIVIAVNLNEEYASVDNKMLFGYSTIAGRSIDILSRYLSKENVKDADIVVNPQVGRVGLFDKFMTSEGTKEVIITGEEAMRANIHKLTTLISKETVLPGKESGNTLPDKFGLLLSGLIKHKDHQSEKG